MTSPAITKSPENQKSAKNSPAHSAGGANQPAAPEPRESRGFASYFGWLRVFKLADLMMRQGC